MLVILVVPGIGLVRLVLGVGLTLPLVAMSALDVFGQAALWENGHWTIAGITAALVALTFIARAPAQASARGRRNTAAVLGAAAAYEALQGDGGTALILGAGALGSVSQ